MRNDTVHLLFDMKQAMISCGDCIEIYVSLYSTTKQAFISEEFCISLTAQGFPASLATKTACLFHHVPAEELAPMTYNAAAVTQTPAHINQALAGAGLISGGTSTSLSPQLTPHQLGSPHHASTPSMSGSSSGGGGKPTCSLRVVAKIYRIGDLVKKESDSKKMFSFSQVNTIDDLMMMMMMMMMMMSDE